MKMLCFPYTRGSLPSPSSRYTHQPQLQRNTKALLSPKQLDKNDPENDRNCRGRCHLVFIERTEMELLVVIDEAIPIPEILARVLPLVRTGQIHKNALFSQPRFGSNKRPTAVIIFSNPCSIFPHTSLAPSL